MNAQRSGIDSSRVAAGPAAATILIVDDEIRNCRLLEALLRPEGYLTVSCSSGQEALDSVARSAPDLVLLDVLMPGMDGYEVASVLKANPATANIPIIMVTAKGDRNARLAGLDAGAEEFLTKPVERAELWLRVRNLLRLKAFSDFLQNHSAILEMEVQARTASLGASELQFRQLAENIREVFWLTDPAKNEMLYVSPAYEEIWGRSCDSIYASPQDWANAIHPEDRERVMQAAHAEQASGNYVQEFRIVRPDGSIRWIRDRAFPVLQNDGEVYRIAGLAEDITESRRAAEELRESERRFSDLLQNVSLISLMLDRDGRITYCNEYLLRLTGWQHDEVIGRNWFKLFIPPESTDASEVFSELIVNRPGAWHHENEILTRLGERRLICWNNSVLRSGAGDVIGTASIGEDITEKKRAEIGIKRLNRVYAVLSGINAVIARVRDRDELFSEACRIAVEQGNFGMAWIGRFDPQTQDITPIAWAGESADAITRAKRSARSDSTRGKGAVGEAVRGRRPIFSNDMNARGFDGPCREELLRLGFHSLVVLPLFEDETIAGTLTLYSRERNFFDEDELRLLTRLAADISFSVDNISRLRKLAKLARIRAVSSEINAAIVRIQERQPLLEQACRIVREHGKFEMIWIAALDHDAQQVEPMAWSGFSDETARSVSWSTIASVGGTLGEAVRNGKPAVRHAIESEMRAGKLRQEALAHGCSSAVALPLIVDGIVVSLIVLFAPGRGFFDEEELALLNEVGADVSFALQAIEKRKKLEYLSYYDALTGLANRSLFLERVAQYMRAASGAHKLALYLIDLERFKNINDSLGQSAGDALLKQVAEWLTRTVGDVSLLARVDADHFAVVMPRVKNESGVVHLLEKQLAGFLDHPFRLNDSVFRIAAKVGVALFPEDGGDADTLFKNAEAALKQAKASRERYLFYTQKMTEAIAGKLTLENQLRQALDNEEFVLHYQPKINLASGLITSAEALIRWNDPRTGLVPPGRFIPVLEETGLIYEVGRWALRKAVEDYLRWCDAGLAAVRIAVNVSPLQLRKSSFITEVEQVLGVDAHAVAGLELEITESLIMEDVKHNIASLQAIRAMGVTIAIDDFGTGFSSLSYLAKLPVDTLKIDRSFVSALTGAPEGLALVSTIIDLAHSLKLKAVAEGVETDEQSRLLRLLGCDEMQGFLFSQPVPGGIFETRFLAPRPTAAPRPMNRPAAGPKLVHDS